MNPRGSLRIVGLAAVLCWVSPILEAAAQSEGPPVEQKLYGTYYNARDFSAFLLLNNKGPRAQEAHIRLFSRQGEPLELTPVTVEPNSWVKLNLGELTADFEALPGKLEGGLEVGYFGEFLEMGSRRSPPGC